MCAEYRYTYYQSSSLNLIIKYAAPKVDSLFNRNFRLFHNCFAAFIGTQNIHSCFVKGKKSTHSYLYRQMIYASHLKQETHSRAARAIQPDVNFASACIERTKDMSTRKYRQRNFSVTKPICCALLYLFMQTIAHRNVNHMPFTANAKPTLQTVLYQLLLAHSHLSIGSVRLRSRTL